MKKIWTWCINNAIISISGVMTLVLGIIAYHSFNHEDTFSETKQTEEKTQIESSDWEQYLKTKDGYILYNVASNISMKKGEIRTFEIPFGTKIQRYNTEGRVTKLSSKGKKYTLQAETDVTFDLTWVIEKGFENKIKPIQ